MKPRQFKIFVAIFLLAFVTFQAFLLTSGSFVIKPTASVALANTPSSVKIEGESGYGINYDNAGYQKLLEYYQTIDLNSLTPEQRERFIKIGTGERTGCGPCCGIGNGPAIDANGNIRCGCGHNLSLIGLMKYLVKEHGKEFTDDQIFEEVVKWKKLFWPGLIDDNGKIIGT